MSKHTFFSRKASGGRAELVSTAVQTSPASSASAPQYERVKIAIDVHGKTWVASRQLENATPQPPQVLSPSQCLKFIEKQVKLARRVVCCYEAGCFGFGPYRQIRALGADCLVIAPRNWDDRKKNVRTDRTDTNAMVQDLDRYEAGNRKALAVVRVPQLSEEVHRSRVRQRKQFQGDRNAWANRGKSLLLYYGLPSNWSWWKPDRWEQTRKAVQAQMPEHAEQILQMLSDYQELAMAATAKLDALTREQQKNQKERSAQKKDVKRICGIGELSMAAIEAEIGDWKRFANRRQVASYTGLCPGVVGTGGKFTELSINRCGNRRLRSVLVELAWLLPRYQSGYLPLQRWKKVLEGKNRSARKKAIIALARRLAVDLWRINTGRATPDKLGLKLAA